MSNPLQTFSYVRYRRILNIRNRHVETALIVYVEYRPNNNSNRIYGKRVVVVVVVDIRRLNKRYTEVRVNRRNRALRTFRKRAAIVYRRVVFKSNIILYTHSHIYL